MTLVLKLACQKCGTEFDWSPQDYTLKGMKNIPKRCPRCCDEMQELEKVVISRRELQRWEGIQISEFPLRREDKRGLYIVYVYGGRDWGVWGGASFSSRELFFVHQSLVEKPFPWAVSIRKMEKTVQRKRENGESTIFTAEYFVIEPTDKPIRWYLYQTRRWHKTTLKGFGKDRNYREYLVPEEGDEVQVVELVSVTSGARSGRYGNTYTLYLADRPCRVEGIGEA